MPNQAFNPLETLRDVSDKTRQTQSDIMNNMSSMQTKSMDTMFNIGQMLPSFMNWGAYKTTISSNGRISIPEAERTALGLDDGDLIQVIILPIVKKSKTKKVKNWVKKITIVNSRDIFSSHQNVDKMLNRLKN